MNTIVKRKINGEGKESTQHEWHGKNYDMQVIFKHAKKRHHKLFYNYNSRQNEMMDMFCFVFTRLPDPEIKQALFIVGVSQQQISAFMHQRAEFLVST